MVEPKNGKLCPSGKVDSTNAPLLDKELFELYTGGPITPDIRAPEYISGAGLRVLLKLRKRTAEVVLENASPAVYEILEITGFADMLTVKQALRTVTVEGLPEIGRGYHGKVYKLSEDMIIKTYHDGSSPETIDRERAFARTAFIEKRLAAFALFRYATLTGGGGPNADEIAARTVPTLRQKLFPYIDDFCRLFAATV